MTTARALAEEGCKVALFDKGKLGQEATWAAGGILSSMRPWAEHPASATLSNAGRREYPTFAQTLKADTGIDPEYVQCGLFMLGKDDVEHTKSWAESNAIRYMQSEAYWPVTLNLTPETLFLPEIAQIRPSRLIQALRKDLSLKKVDVFEQTTVSKIDIHHDRFQSVQTDRQVTSAGALVICAGAWSANILQRLGRRVTVTPVCGQMLCVKTSDAGFREIVLDGGHYLIPRLDGHVLIGSSMEYTGFEKVTTAAVKQELMDWAGTVWPQVTTTMLVSHWAGLRPGNEEGRPYIGKVPAIEGLYLNTGHFRKGIVQAPVSARLLVDTILEKPVFTDIEPYCVVDTDQ